MRGHRGEGAGEAVAMSNLLYFMYVVCVDANLPFWIILLLNNVVLLVIKDK